MSRWREVSGHIISVSRLLSNGSGCAPPLCTVLVINGWAFSGKNLKNRSQVSPASVRRKVNAEWLVVSSVMWCCSHLVQSECSSCTCVEVLLLLCMNHLELELFWSCCFINNNMSLCGCCTKAIFYSKEGHGKKIHVRDDVFTTWCSAELTILDSTSINYALSQSQKHR